MIELEVYDIRNSKTSAETYLLFLKAKGENDYLSIMTGLSEARSIALEINKMHAKRPTPYDIIRQLAEHCKLSFDKIIINKYEDGIYYAEIQMNQNGTVVSFDSRPSDAVVLALKTAIPIFITDEIFERNKLSFTQPITKNNSSDNVESALISNNNTENNEMDNDNYIEQKIKEMSIKELQILLDGAIESEDYELASRIHDEMRTRKQR